MQKKIIALAIAAAMAAPVAALAEVTVYGQANVAFEVVDNGGDASPAPVGTAAESRNHVASNVSRIGFKGSEDLGNGLTGVFQMEGEVAMDTGTAGSGGTADLATGETSAARLFNRNTFVGVAGGFGTVVLGQHDTMYKMSTRGMDVFADSIADNRSLMGLAGINLDVRVTDVMAYVSPDFSGFNFAVGYVGETDNTLTATADAVLNLLGAPTLTPGTSKVGATTLSAQYGMDNWKAVLGYIAVNVKDSTAPALKLDVEGTKVGGTFGMDAFAVNAVYEMTALKVNGTKAEQNNIYVSGTYNVTDAGKVKLAYTMAGEVKVAGQTAKGSGASQVSVGYDHAMTKNTTLFASYSMIANDYDTATATGSSYGFTSGGSTADTAAAGLGAGESGDPTALSIGIRHSF